MNNNKVRYAAIKYNGDSLDTFLSVNLKDGVEHWELVFYFGDITVSYDLIELKKILTLAEQLKESSKPEDWVTEDKIRKAYAKRQVEVL